VTKRTFRDAQPLYDFRKRSEGRIANPTAVYDFWLIKGLYDFWLIKEPPQPRSRAVLATPVILEIEGIEAGEVPLISNIPKSLQISTRTSIGPMVVRISESAALELTEALATHWQLRGSQ
jgi:hypothetical protein